VVNGRRSTEVTRAFRRPGFGRPKFAERWAARRDPRRRAPVRRHAPVRPAASLTRRQQHDAKTLTLERVESLQRSTVRKQSQLDSSSICNSARFDGKRATPRIRVRSSLAPTIRTRKQVSERRHRCIEFYPRLARRRHTGIRRQIGILCSGRRRAARSVWLR